MNLNYPRWACTHELSLLLACLNNNKTFIHHISPSEFDIHAINPREEVQLLIERSILKFKKNNKEMNSFLDIVFILLAV